jgi:3'-5' exoribonuclease
MGKVHEYTIAGKFGFTEDGRLLGHIVRALLMVETAVSTLGTFTDDESRQLLHLIASHHGKQEWGSPVEPKTIEAVLLHQIDLLDSRIQGFIDHVKNSESDTAWTKKSWMFGHELKRP